jgi:hypothetical protein
MRVRSGELERRWDVDLFLRGFRDWGDEVSMGR